MKSVRDTLMFESVRAPDIENIENTREEPDGRPSMEERENAAIAMEIWPVVASVVSLSRPRAAYSVNGNIRAPHVPRKDSRPWSGFSSSSDELTEERAPGGNEIYVATRMPQTTQSVHSPPRISTAESGEVVPLRLDPYFRNDTHQHHGGFI